MKTVEKIRFVLLLTAGLLCMMAGGCKDENGSENPVDEVASADIGISATATPKPVKAGENLTYAITIRNNGPQNAQGVSASGTLPGNVTFVSASQGGSHNNGTVSWSPGNLASGASLELSLVVGVPADAAHGTSLSFTITVSSQTNDPVGGNNSVSESADVASQADLAITKTGDPETVSPGAETAFVISVENKGPNNARDVTVTDVLPAGLTFISATEGGSHQGGTVRWNLADMASGTSRELNLVVQVGNDVAPGTKINNTATISGSTIDPETGNNSASSEIEVGMPPDDEEIFGSVEGLINEVAFAEDESHTTVTFNRFCHTIEKFTELQSQIATTPQGAVVMMLIAMRIYQQYPIEGMKCMTAACTSPLTSPSSNPGSYDGMIMTNVSTLRERLQMYPYLPLIYLQGASPQNGYNPDGPPFVVKLYTNVHSYSMATDGVRIKLYVESLGADSNRPVTVKKVGNIYKVTEFSSLYVSPKPPVNN